MRHSLRGRLFVSICTLTVSFVLVSLALNEYLLPRYYYYLKRSDLTSKFAAVYTLYTGDTTKLSATLQRWERAEGLRVTIFDATTKPTYDSFMFRDDAGSGTLARPQGQQLTQRRSSAVPTARAPVRPGGRLGTNSTGASGPTSTPRPTDEGPHGGPRMSDLLTRLVQAGALAHRRGEFALRVDSDPVLQFEYVSLVGRLSNGDLLLLRTPAAAIQESARTATRFFLLTGALILVGGSVFAYTFAGRFTRPIREMSDLAERMSRLDFSERCAGHSGDELGVLGMSLNDLSAQLQESIGELRVANESLKDDLERKDRLESMRKGFIADVSHELKTPISLIQGYAEGLKILEADDSDNRDYYCGVIEDEARKMDRLVRQLLELSKIESGHQKPQRSEFPIGELMAQVVRKASKVFADKGVEVALGACVGTTSSGPRLAAPLDAAAGLAEAEYAHRLLESEAPGDRAVSADIHMVEQVLTNYLTNAAKHVNAGGKVRLWVAQSASKARVYVHNTGSSVPAEHEEQIWTSFYKVDQARTREYESSGLGLSIVKAIQDAHGNACGLENTNDGVTFWFDLDLAAPA